MRFIRFSAIILFVLLPLAIRVHGQDVIDLGIIPDEASTAIANELIATLGPLGDSALGILATGVVPTTTAFTGDFGHVSICKTSGAGSQYLFKTVSNNKAVFKVPINCPDGTTVLFTIPLTKKYTISGTITNSATGSPVVGANVAAADYSATTTTDENGQYTLAGLPAGDISLTVGATYFITQITTVTVLSDDVSGADFGLLWTFEHAFYVGADWRDEAALHLQVTSSKCLLSDAQTSCDCVGNQYIDESGAGLTIQYVSIPDVTSCSSGESDSYVISVYGDGPVVNFAGALFDNSPAFFATKYPAWLRTSVFTIELQVKALSPGMLFRWRYYGYGLSITNSGAINGFGCAADLSCPSLVTNVTNVLADSTQWHHIAYTRNLNTSQLYYDGILLKSAPNVGAIYFETGDRVAVGGDGTAGTAYYGYMKNLRFWNSERSATDIFNNKDTTITTPVDGLLLNVEFDGTLVDGLHKDYSGNGNNLNAAGVTYAPAVVIVVGATTGVQYEWNRQVSDVWADGWTVASISTTDGNVTTIDVLGQ